MRKTLEGMEGMNFRTLLAAIIMALSCEPAYAAGKARFEVPALGDSVTIAGDKATVDGELVVAEGKISGTFTVRLADFKTGITMRDGHMCEDLECTKFPVATFILAPTLIGSTTKIAGEMELHGVKKMVIGTASMLTAKTIKAELKIPLEDFGIKRRKHLGIGVGDVATVYVEL